MSTFFVTPTAVNPSTNEENPIKFLASDIYLSDKSTTVQSAISTLRGYFTNGVANKANILNTSRNFSITGGATAAAVSFNGNDNVALNVTSLDATKLTGTIDIARIPAGALERMTVVADIAARNKLTTATVQVGDLVKVVSTKTVYYVKDTANLANDNGYEEFPMGTAAAVAWSNVTDKPSTFNPASHTHSLKDLGVIGTAPTSGQVAVFDGTTGKIKSTGYTIAKSVPSTAVFTDQNCLHTSSATTKFYLSGATSDSTNTASEYFDPNIYVTTTAGQLHVNSLIIGHAELIYDSTTGTIVVQDI